MQQDAGWFDARDSIHRQLYDRLDVLWTEIGYAWGIVDDANVSDDIGDINDNFLEYGHYALTKRSFGVDSADAVARFREEAEDIYRQALRRTADVWRRAAEERVRKAKAELDRTLANIGTDTKDAWEKYEDASTKFRSGDQELTAANDGSFSVSRLNKQTLPLLRWSVSERAEHDSAASQSGPGSSRSL